MNTRDDRSGGPEGTPSKWYAERAGALSGDGRRTTLPPATSTDSGSGVPEPASGTRLITALLCATRPEQSARTGTALHYLAATFALLTLAACAPGERLGVVVEGVCLCPEDDAGADAGTADAAPPPDAQAHTWTRLHYLADSVPVYGASDVAHRAVTLIAATYPGTFTAQAVGGRSLNFYASTPTRAESMAQAIVYGPPNGPLTRVTEVWIALGYNDYAGALWTAAEFGAAYADFAARLVAKMGPTGRLYCQTTTTLHGAPNARGETLAQFDAAISTACTSVGGRVVPGSLVGLQQADRLDVVHLRDSGHAKLADFTVVMGGW